jgi:hypothetical protein
MASGLWPGAAGFAHGRAAVTKCTRMMPWPDSVVMMGEAQND